jgi:hypothetical protein
MPLRRQWQQTFAAIAGAAQLFLLCVASLLLPLRTRNDPERANTDKSIQ